jgi:hypothetical protein
MATPASPPAPVNPSADPYPAGAQKVAAASGIAFAVTLIVTIVLTGATTPEQSAPATEWSKYAADNEGGARIGALVMIFGVYQLLWFGGYLRSVLGRAEEAARGFARMANVVLAGAIVGAVGLGFGVLMNATSLTYEESNPELIRGLHNLAGSGFGLGSAGFAAMLLAAGFINTRVPAVPRWLGIVAFAGGLSFLLQNLTLLSEEYDNVAGIFYPLGFLFLVIFCIGASVGFIRSVGRE